MKRTQLSSNDRAITLVDVLRMADNARDDLPFAALFDAIGGRPGLAMLSLVCRDAALTLAPRLGVTLAQHLRFSEQAADDWLDAASVCIRFGARPSAGLVFDERAVVMALFPDRDVVYALEKASRAPLTDALAGAFFRFLRVNANCVRLLRRNRYSSEWNARCRNAAQRMLDVVQSSIGGRSNRSAASDRAAVQHWQNQLANARLRARRRADVCAKKRNRQR